MLRLPAVLVGRLFDPTGDGQVALIQLAGVAGGVRSDGRREHCTDGDYARREGGCNPFLQGHLHVETLY